jgi:hypothetical protein
MTEAAIKSNLLLIAMMGLALFAVGSVLYLFAGRLTAHGHLLLPFPPIAVAAYVYVNNWMSRY